MSAHAMWAVGGARKTRSIASHQVIMNGPSYRPNKRPKNPSDKP
ncbi:hypothetical protein [Streptomyces sp. NPDC058758]